MIHGFSVADVRAAEQARMAEVPEGALMQRASTGLATQVLRVLRERHGGVYGRSVLLLVGPGANGGDALWAGARLRRRGVRVVALLTHERVHEEGLTAFRRDGGRVLDARTPESPYWRRLQMHPETTAEFDPDFLREFPVVVDGLLGIGGRPGLSGIAATLPSLLPDEGQTVVSVDLPSGVDPDTGEVSGPHMKADVVVTFGLGKACLLLPPAALAVRHRVVRYRLGIEEPEPDDRGVVVLRLEDADVARLWPVPGSSDHKYSRGVVGVVAGGENYTGAAVLACDAAVLAGAGMVRYVGPPHPTELVRQRRPEVVPGGGRVQAWVLGPGVDPDDAEQVGHVRAALSSDTHCVVDAGALSVVPDLVDGEYRPWLLTPHAGELAALLTALGRPCTREEVEAAPVEHARRARQATGAAVLLKGAVTVVVDHDEAVVWSQASAPTWLATAGAGDVLAGTVGTLLAASAVVHGDADELPLGVDGAMAAHVHGLAATRASSGGPLTALAVAEALPATIAALLTAP